MRALITIASLLASSAASAEGPPTVIVLEQQNYVIDGDVQPDINLTFVRPIWGSFGIYSFSYIDRLYAESIVGPSWSACPWLTLGAGTGIEQAGQAGSWRIGGLIWLGNERHSWTTLVETGASGFWMRSEYAWKLQPWIGIGFLTDRLAGTGPRIELNVSRFQFWAAPLYGRDSDKTTPAFGLRLNI